MSCNLKYHPIISRLGDWEKLQKFVGKQLEPSRGMALWLMVVAGYGIMIWCSNPLHGSTLMGAFYVSEAGQISCRDSKVIG